jgi:hypothetical protein
MIKTVSVILFLMGVSALSALGQQPKAEPLSYADVNAIVQAVLEQPTQLGLLSRLAYLKTVSSENIEFVDSSQLTKLAGLCPGVVAQKCKEKLPNLTGPFTNQKKRPVCFAQTGPEHFNIVFSSS